MTHNEQDFTSDSESSDQPPLEDFVSDDDLRYAPPPEPTDMANTIIETGESLAVSEFRPTEGMDIEAALAAVSTISDMLAEQEAEEQARIAREEAAAQAAAERQARLEHPEQFFPVPPQLALQRGSLASIVPALILMVIGAWLTFTLTTTQALPDRNLIGLAVGGGLMVILLARWLSAGRWGRGLLFIALSLLLTGAATFVLTQTNVLSLSQGWPLVLIAPGLAFIMTSFLAQPQDRRLILPGVLFIAAGAVGFVVTDGLLNTDLLNFAGTLWPAVLAIIAGLWLLPLVFRQRS